MAEQTSSLIVRLIDQVTGPARTVAGSIRGIFTATKGGASFTDRVDAAIARNNRRLSDYRMQMVDAAATLYTLKRAVSAPVEAARKFEAAFADVKKVVEFPAEGPYAASAFRRALIDLSRRVPLTVEELTQIAAAGGQAGVALEELTGFTENVAQVSTAFEISTGEAGKALANLKGALRLSNPEVMLLSDHMNVLANNMATSERQVLDVVNRVGALGAVVGVNARHVAALGAAMTSAGADAESAGTAIRNMFLNLAQGSGMSKDQRKAMKQLGLDPARFPKRMQTQGVAALVDLLERVAKLPKEKQAATLTDLFDKRAVDAIGPLLNNLDLLRQALGLVADDTANAGASQREFEKRTDTFDARMKTFGNTLNSLNIAIGDALIPALTTVLAKITPVVSAIGEWAAAHPRLTAAIVGAVGGLFLLNAAMTVFRFASAIGYGGFLNLIKGVTDLGAAFTTLKGAIASTGLGALVILIAMAGVWIYNNWSGIAAMFDAFGRAFMNALGPGTREALTWMIDKVSALWGWVSGLLGPIAQTEEGWRSWGRTAGEAVAGIVNTLTGLPGTIRARAGEMFAAGAAFIQSLWDGMRSIFDQLIAWVNEKIDQITEKASNIGSAFGYIGRGVGQAAPAAAGQADGEKAGGGPVARGNAYVVGERGPEIFRPSTSGTIIPNRQLGGGSTTIAPTFNITVNGNADAATVERIRRVLRDEVRQAFRGVYADAGLRFA